MQTWTGSDVYRWNYFYWPYFGKTGNTCIWIIQSTLISQNTFLDWVALLNTIPHLGTSQNNYVAATNTYFTILFTFN